MKWYDQISILDRESSAIASKAKQSIGVLDRALQKAAEQRERKRLAQQKIAQIKGEKLMRSLKKRAIDEGRMKESGEYYEWEETPQGMAIEQYQADIAKVYDKVRVDYAKDFFEDDYAYASPEQIQILLSLPEKAAN